jgi:hypothetical protein
MKEYSRQGAKAKKRESQKTSFLVFSLRLGALA